MATPLTPTGVAPSTPRLVPDEPPRPVTPRVSDSTTPRTPRTPEPEQPLTALALLAGQASGSQLHVSKNASIGPAMSGRTSDASLKPEASSAPVVAKNQPHGYLAQRRSSLDGSQDGVTGRANSKEARSESKEVLDQPWRDSHRRQANQFRAKALHFMQLEHLVKNDAKSTQRGVLREVVAKQHKHNTGCLELPLNIAFFVLYALSAHLHEDITNVWFLESEMRNRLDGTLKHVNTIDDVWAWLKTDMMDMFFVQKDYYGDELPATEWSRVLLYSQVQGAVVLTQARENAEPWGIAHTGPLSEYLTTVKAENRGFVSKASAVATDTLVPLAQTTAGGRRLNKMRAMWMKSHLPGSASDDSTYDFKLYPTLPANLTKEHIEYLEKRQWLDQNTNSLTITALLLNGELGRPRLEQVTVALSFSRGGGIWNIVDLQALFLVSYSGLMSVGVDAMWVTMLMANSVNCVWKLWIAFLEARAFAALAGGVLPLELFIMALGWLNVGGFFIQTQLAEKTATALQDLRQLLASDTTTGRSIKEEAMSDRLHSDASDFIMIMLQARTGIAWMTLVLIFRFFSSFRVQPRLAVVTNTLKAVMNDLAHFVVVFAPTFFAYAISGHFLFGRRLEGWSTVEGSIGICMRIAFENEFEWLELSEEFFSTAALWIWSYLLFVVLIMMNMVLAIVLDIYNEVRQSTDVGNTIVKFFEEVAMGLWHRREYVADHEIECLYGDGVDESTTLHEQDFIEALPHMGQTQRGIVLKACEEEMTWQAKRSLANTNFLKLGASLKLSVDEAADEIQMADNEFHGASDSKSLGASYTVGSEASDQPHTPRQKGRLAGASQAFPGMIPIPGGYAPPMCPPTKDHPGVLIKSGKEKSEADPDWLRALHERMESSSEMMDNIQDALHGLHLQWHNLDINVQKKELADLKACEGRMRNAAQRQREKEEKEQEDFSQRPEDFEESPSQTLQRTLSRVTPAVKFANDRLVL